MKRKLSILLTVLFAMQAFELGAQILEPVKWRFTSEKTAENEYKLLFIADIAPSWYLYSQDITMSPPATTFHFEEKEGFELIGKVSEGASIEKYDPNFEMVVKFFDRQATFTQKIRLTSSQAVNINGFVEFMSCDDTRCIPPTEIDFSFTLTPDSSGPSASAPRSGILQPVSWDIHAIKQASDEYQLVFKATIDEGFDLYSVNVPENGPLPTEFSYENADSHFTVMGPTTEESTGKIKYDEIFEMEIKSFREFAEFRQRIKITGEDAFAVQGEIAYMVCNQVGCVALYEDFTVSYDGKGNLIVGDETTPLVSESVQRAAAIQGGGVGLWGFFFLAFLGGLAAIVTPCVFPMIPMTVAFFMKDKEHKTQGKIQASVYGLSIIAIYTLIGTALAVIAGPGFANWLSTHWFPNVLFFLVFVFFAAAFFGMFELTLPSWLVNKSDAKADKGGYVGTIFMALTLVLVSFSCTGPIVGTILVASAGGEVLMPIIGMFGFSLAFALPFTLFAFFPSWLSGLPKSGGWLNSVKVVLGFIELALGLKFLSIADQTYHWGILDRDIYLAFWIVIFFLMGMYLLGKMKFAHDSEIKYLSVPRLMLAIITFTFVVYLIPGMFGAPLKALSGYLPPQHTHDFDLNQIIRSNVKTVSMGGALTSKQANELCETPKHSDKLHLPHGLQGYYDYEQGVACAKALNKPIFIDFTGHGCVNCREMEANVWSDPRVLEILEREYLIIALYVDDKTSLPESEWITSTYDGKVKKTIGRKYADFQIAKFGVNAQPYYVLMGHDNQVLTEPKAYDLNVDNFIRFLREGVEAFEKGQSLYRIP
jgi:thiol:disulfide interchange protein